MLVFMPVLCKHFLLYCSNFLDWRLDGGGGGGGGKLQQLPGLEIG